mmetsp:Transcript_32056/g.80460  ORF Transcript_32056/g.80460 Transcript_32056/m.80460 type:complete len:219 (-) Transcript_32056:86-742(-)
MDTRSDHDDDDDDFEQMDWGVPAEVMSRLDEFEAALSELEHHLHPFFRIDLHKELLPRLSPLQQAKMKVMTAYAINALFYMYLKTQGILPAQHPVKQELNRVRLYIEKLKDIELKEKQANGEEPVDARSTLVNQEACKRVISRLVDRVYEANTSAQDDDSAVSDEKHKKSSGRGRSSDNKKKSKKTSKEDSSHNKNTSGKATKRRKRTTSGGSKRARA